MVEAVTVDVPGRVVRVESDDDRYLVEVLTDSGSKLELVLDTEFRVTGTDTDAEEDTEDE